MKICMVLDKPFPPDIRVEKEARSLIKCGHEVHLLCFGEKNETEIIENIYVHRIFFDKSSIIKKILNFGSFFNYFYINKWCEELLKLHEKESISVFHAHDLTTAPYTFLAGKRINIPVVFDMHEDYVSMISSGMERKNIIRYIGLFLLIILPSMIWERISLALSSRIIVVVEEEINRLTAMNVPLDKIEVISNTVDIDELIKIGVSDLHSGFNNEYIISYVGGFSRHRGLDTLVMAMPLILDKIPNAHLLLVGDGIMKDYLFKMCKDLNIEKNVTFTGWVPFKEAMNYIKSSNLCVIPYHRTRQTVKSFPHKLSQYMYFEKPILVSDVLSLKRIVEETKCGIVFKASDHNDLARKLIKAKEQGILEQLGKNGRIAAEKKYNWHETSNKLVRLYENLESRKKISKIRGRFG